MDTYTYVAAATGRVRFFATGSAQLGGGADPVLRVFDAQRTELASNDDATDSTRDALIELDVVGGVTYHVGVTGYSPDAGRCNTLTGDGPAALATASVGGYTLTVADLTPVVVVPPVVVPPPLWPGRCSSGDYRTAPQSCSTPSAGNSSWGRRRPTSRGSTPAL